MHLDLGREFDTSLRAAVRPVATVLALLFALFAVSHPWVVPAPARAPLTALAAITAALLAGLSGWLRRHELPPGSGHLVASAIAGLVLLDSLAHQLLVHDPVQTTNLMLLVLGVGLFFYSAAWAGAVIALSLAGWVAVSAADGLAQDGDWLHFAFALTSSAAIAFLTLIVRRRQFAQMLALRAQDASQRAAVERARADLEKRVAQRTEALAIANEQLLGEVAERQLAEGRLRQAKERAEALERTKSEFLDIASHELRTPMTALKLLVQRARQRRARGEAWDESLLERVELHVVRLAQMVDDLLDTSRLGRDQLVIRPAPIDLGELVREEVESFRMQADGRPVTLSLPAQPLRVRGDATRLTQVLLNLLDNASKYSPPGSPIEVHLEPDAGQARVSVTDRGPGIPAEQQQKLFARFFRAGQQQAPRHSGLGLGLYLARMIVQMHGGQLDVSSAPGDGSTFWFTLPLEAERAVPAESQPHA